MGVRVCCLVSSKTSSMKLNYLIFIKGTTISCWIASIVIWYTRTGGSTKAKFLNASYLPIKTSCTQLTNTSTLKTSWLSSKDITSSHGEKFTGRYGHILISTNVDNVKKFIILVELKDARIHQKMVFILITQSMLEIFWMKNGKIIVFNYSMKL